MEFSATKVQSGRCKIFGHSVFVLCYILKVSSADRPRAYCGHTESVCMWSLLVQLPQLNWGVGWGGGGGGQTELLQKFTRMIFRPF